MSYISWKDDKKSNVNYLKATLDLLTYMYEGYKDQSYYVYNWTDKHNDRTIGVWFGIEIPHYDLKIIVEWDGSYSVSENDTKLTNCKDVKEIRDILWMVINRQDIPEFNFMEKE